MLYQALLPASLVDQLALITFAVMLGRGKRWYSGDPTTARSWTLLEQAHSPKGVHFAVFARDGEVRTGSFAKRPPSDDELRFVSVKRRVVGEPAALRVLAPIYVAPARERRFRNRSFAFAIPDCFVVLLFVFPGRPLSGYTALG